MAKLKKRVSNLYVALAMEIEVLETSFKRKKYDNPMENPNTDVTTRENHANESNDSIIVVIFSTSSFRKAIVKSIGIESKFLAKFIPVGVWFGKRLFKILFSAIGITTEQKVLRITQWNPFHFNVTIDVTANKQN